MAGLVQEQTAEGRTEGVEVEAFHYAESEHTESERPSPVTPTSRPSVIVFSEEETPPSGFSSTGVHGHSWRVGTDGRLEPREFTEASVLDVEAAPPDALDSEPQQSSNDAAELADRQLFQQLLVVETGKAEANGRSRGKEEGIAQGREEAHRQMQNERDRLTAQAADLLRSFSVGNKNYLHQLEEEAVRLSLAIAARILRREAQADPLLLSGAVRVALGQLAASTSVRLLVPVQDEAMWEETLVHMPGLAIRPRVVGVAGMELGECKMETELGSADLGLWSQLKAIERGFFTRAGETNSKETNPSQTNEFRGQVHSGAVHASQEEKSVPFKTVATGELIRG